MRRVKFEVSKSICPVNSESKSSDRVNGQRFVFTSKIKVSIAHLISNLLRAMTWYQIKGHENEVWCSLAAKCGNKNISLSRIILTVVYCPVVLCQNYCNPPELSYFRFPTDKQLAVWLKFCRRANSS